MKVLIAPDKFKGCLPAADVAAAMADGVRDVVPSAEVDLCPMADGGDGTAEVVLAARGGRRVDCRAVGPLPERSVDASFVLLDDGTAVVEMAAASGLALLDPADRDPLRTTTFGTGQLIAAAVGAGAKRLLLTLGGSATVDGGIGCLQACRFSVLTTDGEPVPPTEPLCGRDLDRVLMVKRGRGEVTHGLPVVAACDVVNPLCGPDGAARVFGPQKGASPEAVEWLDAQLRRLSQSHPDEAELPGAGAAGGMGFAVAAHFGGRLASGFALVADVVALAARLVTADLCLTGEGRLDNTSAGGKTVGGVGRLCATVGVPCLAVVGSITAGTALPTGVAKATALIQGTVTTADAMRDAGPLLRRRTAEVVRAWTLGRGASP